MDEHFDYEIAAARAAEVDAIIQRITPFLAEEPVAHVLMAMLTISFLCQDAKMDNHALYNGIMGASEWIVHHIQQYGSAATSSGDKKPYSQLN